MTDYLSFSSDTFIYYFDMSSNFVNLNKIDSALIYIDKSAHTQVGKKT
ncbi:MAG: hypothetical protein HJHJAOHD_02534 [Flavobacteriales bacterium]|nr:hypothetical protein [Flavobacteriales bacterium]